MWRNWSASALPAGACKSAAAMGNTSEVPQKLNTEWAYGLAIPLLSVYPRELKTGVQTESSTWVLLAALFIFIIAEIWKHPKCLSTADWISRAGCSGIKRSEVLPHVTTEMGLQEHRVKDAGHQSHLRTEWSHSHDLSRPGKSVPAARSVPTRERGGRNGELYLMTLHCTLWVVNLIFMLPPNEKKQL